MKIGLLLLIAAITRESIVTNIALIQARQAEISWVLIHTIFITGTVLDIIVPYYFAKIFLKKTQGKRVGNFLENNSEKVLRLFNKFGEGKGLFIIGFFGSVAIDSLIVAWLRLSFKKAFVIFFVSDVFWYITIVLVNTGIISKVSDNKTAIYILAIFAIIFTIITRKIFHIFTKI